MSRICLAVENGLHDKSIYPLADSITIGRHKDNTITLADPIVSRFHAKLSFTEGHWTVEDLGSANGTTFQGQRITKKMLNLGDFFQIGVSLFRLVKAEDSTRASLGYQRQLAESNGLVDLLESCFDEQGVFDRQVFLDKTVLLAPNHERIFRLLLSHLKRAEDRTSRISLVNTIPALYDSIEGTGTAIRELLVEFCNPAETINYYDRNVLMLAAQLLRHYRKEDGLDIEMTPEEVLLVQKGLREDEVKLGRKTAGEFGSELQTKLSTIHTALIDSLSKSDCKKAMHFPSRFLSTLLREFYILMALIGGPEAKALVWRGALATSSPKSRLYHQQLSKTFFDNLLGLLRIIVRSCHRLVEDGCADDIKNLKALRQRIHVLVSSTENESKQSVLRRLCQQIDTRLETSAKKQQM
jgi:hypothetical protein